MRTPHKAFTVFAACAALLAAAALGTSGQDENSAPRITQSVDESRLTVLRGNISPLARSARDLGPAAPSLPMDHMLLVLRRGPGQEASLEALLARQQDRGSPDYHRWLTPREFGREFGPSDQDIQAVTLWLESHGFQVNAVSHGRTLIDFSGVSAQVQSAFHTAIHRYSVRGEEHWANSSDPMIPAALAPVVVGIHALNNFRPRPMAHSLGAVRRDKATGKFTRLNPEFTYPLNCQNTQSGCNLALGPYDFAQEYNVTPAWNAGINGTSVTIAVVGDSNINPADVANFRSAFGLSANAPKVTIVPAPLGDGADPGLTGDEGEATLDVQWAGAVATGATINLVIADPNTTNGVDTAAEYAVDNDIAPILSESFGSCEAQLGAAGNAFYNAMWQQAASEGITVVVASGDQGPAGCEPPPPPQSNWSAQPATTGLAVSGLASTPYDVAVGGTDFNDFANASMYWSVNNAPITQASLLSYVPEIPYNDSCGNPVLATLGAGFTGDPESDCNASAAITDQLVQVVGSGGGPSNCTGGAGGTNTCTPGHYSKPSWQAGPGVPADGARDIPDVSLFAGDGLSGSFYIVCQQDQNTPAGTPCNLNSPYNDFVGFGGTSVSTQAFAGIMALVNQKAGGAQGNPNPVLYALASQQSQALIDVSAGGTASPCQPSTPNCTRTSAGDTYGILTSGAAPAYGAGAGYDLATGLGSVNVSNLVNAWGPNFSISSQNPAINIATSGGSGSMNVTVAAINGFTGTVALACSGLPSGDQCSFNPASAVLTSSSTSVPVTVGVGPSGGLAPPRAMPFRFHRPSPLPLAAFAATLMLLALLVLLTRTRFLAVNRRPWVLGLAAASLSTMALLIGCSGGSHNSGAGGGGGGTTTATLTGSAPNGSSTITFSMQFTVTTP